MEIQSKLLKLGNSNTRLNGKIDSYRVFTKI